MMNPNLRRWAEVLMVVLVAAARAHGAQLADAKTSDWPQWRGPDRNGVVPAGPKLMDSLPADGPKLVWKSEYIPFGWWGGWGSPVVAEGKVFLYVQWLHPNGGGNYIRPVTPELLEAMGWIPGVPDDLAKKLDEAWASPNRTTVVKGMGVPDMIKKPDLDAYLAKQPELDKYIKDFMGTLKPEDAQKYGTFIKRRLCLKPVNINDGSFPWEILVKFSKLQGQEFKTLSAFDGAMQRLDNEAKHPHGDRSFVTEWAGQAGYSTTTDTLICLDAETGKTLWKKDFPVAKPGGYPLSTTPAVANGKVCFCGSSGTYCLSTKDGSDVWHKPGGGSQASVLIAESLVYDPGARAAYDLDTGKLLWQPKNWQGGSGDSSPVVWNNGARKCIIIKGLCLDSQNGDVLWKGINQNESTPVVVGNELVAAASLYKLASDNTTRVWKQIWGFDRSSPLVYQDHIFVNTGQSYCCADFETGAEKWHKDGIGTDMNSPISADGKIIAFCGPGHSHNDVGCGIVIFRATPKKYEEIGRFDPHAASCESPAIANGKLYFRTESPDGDYGVACYDLMEHRPYFSFAGMRGRQLLFECHQAEGGLAAAGAIKGVSIKDAAGPAKPAASRLEGNTLAVDMEGLSFPVEVSYGEGNLAAKNGALAPFHWTSPSLSFVKCEGHTLTFDFHGDEEPNPKVWSDPKLYDVSGKVTAVEVSDWTIRLITEKEWRMTDELTLRYPAVPGDASTPKLELKMGAGLLATPVGEKPLQEFLFGEQRKGVPAPEIAKTLSAEVSQYQDLKPARSDKWKIWNIMPDGNRFALNTDFLGVGQILTPMSVYVYADKDRKVQLLYKHFGCGILIVINSKAVVTNDKGLDDHNKIDQTNDVELKQGWNTVLLTTAGISTDFWQFDFNLSIRDEQGKVPTGLWYRADRPAEK